MDRTFRIIYLYQRTLLGIVVVASFAVLYLASQLFGNEGIKYLFAEIEGELFHTAGHIMVYGTLSVLLARVLGGRYLSAWVICNLLAAGEEWHQLVVPGRVASIEDGLLNLVSITFFIALAKVAEPLIRARLRRPLPLPQPENN